MNKRETRRFLKQTAEDCLKRVNPAPELRSYLLRRTYRHLLRIAWLAERKIQHL